MQPMSVLLTCNDKYEVFFFPSRIGYAGRMVPARRSGSAEEAYFLYYILYIVTALLCSFPGRIDSAGRSDSAEEAAQKCSYYTIYYI